MDNKTIETLEQVINVLQDAINSERQSRAALKNMSIGEQLRARRLQLGKEKRISNFRDPQWLHRIEKGDIIPSGNSILKLCDWLDCHIEIVPNF